MVNIKQVLLGSFPAFRHRNYRIFFSAQIIALTGTWMRMVAQGYLAFQLTHSPFWVGAITAIGTLPSTFLSLLGGVILDHFPRKNVLQITQSLQFIIGIIFGVLTIAGHTNLFLLGVFAFLVGIVNAVDQPARISIIAELVDKEDLHSATALNISMFNSARIVGPAMAGFLIAGVGVGWAFLLNGLSYFAPFVAYQFINFAPFVRKVHRGTLFSIKEGVHYATTHPLIKLLLLYLTSVSIFGWSYVTILPVISEKVFGLSASGLGTLYSAAGAGSVLGAILMSAWARKFDYSKLILIGGLIFSLSLLAFSLTQNIYFGILTLFLGGIGITTQNSTIQAIIQHHVHDHFRGRVSSIQTLVLTGLAPIGSFQIGWLSEHFGSQLAIRLGAVIILISAIALYIKRPRIS